MEQWLVQEGCCGEVARNDDNHVALLNWGAVTGGGGPMALLNHVAFSVLPPTITRTWPFDSYHNYKLLAPPRVWPINSTVLMNHHLIETRQSSSILYYYLINNKLFFQWSLFRYCISINVISPSPGQA